MSWIWVARSRFCWTMRSASSIERSETLPWMSAIARSDAARMSSDAFARISAASTSARAIRSLRTCSADWRGSSMIRPASVRGAARWGWEAAGSGVRQLALVVGELGLGLVADRLGVLQVAADLVLAVLQCLLDGRPRLPREQR